MAHLLPGDGLEAVALAMCGRAVGPGPAWPADLRVSRQALVVHRLVLVPYSRCERAENRVTWPTDLLVPLLTEAARRNFAILKIHSHPGDYRRFSPVDDASDREFFGAVASWLDDEERLQYTKVEPGSYDSAIIILLTDGATTAGPDPLAAGQLAADFGVRVFTVAFGSREGSIVNFAGRRMRADDMRTRLDTNGDGKVTADEIGNSRRARGLQMQEADTNGDGDLSVDELDTALRERGSQRARRRFGGNGDASAAPAE